MTHPSSTAASSSLDGRRFEGVVLERGKTSGDADTLIFERGLFRSTACDQYGYGDGAYTLRTTGEGLAFAAETTSPLYGSLRWAGTVRGEKLDATLIVIRDGKPTAEKWVVAGEVR